MAVLIFVLFWVLLALGLLAVGMSSNRRRSEGVNVSRGGRAYWYVGFALVVLGFGVGVPLAATSGAQRNSRSVPSEDIAKLTADEQRGRALFRKYCSVCHTLKAVNAVASVGPDLDELRPTKGLVLDAIKKGRARGNGAMARDLVVGKDAEDVASFVSVAVGQGGK